jgi:hypothetical protein
VRRDLRPSAPTAVRAGRTLSLVLTLLFAGWTGTAQAGFAPAVALDSADSPEAVAVGDFNGDGKQDVVSASASPGSTSVALGHGDGTFDATKTKVWTGSDLRQSAVGDFNGDGVQDLAVAVPNPSSGLLLLLKGAGDGTFTSSSVVAGARDTMGVAAGDFTSDGNQDLAAVTQGGEVAVLQGHGDGTFSSLGGATAGNDGRSIAVGDFDGDASLDLATVSLGPGTVSILRGNGAGAFSAASTPAVGTSPSWLAIGDFNGDVTQDIATANHNPNGTVSVLTGNGGGTFGTAGTPGVGANPGGVAVGDFNADSNQDLATANGAGTVSVLTGNGGASFTAADSPAVGANAVAVAVGDFNGDGNEDLATANQNAPGTVSVLLSTDPPAANLLSDGAADAAVGAPTAAGSPLPPGWTREDGSFTNVRYGAVGGFPDILAAAPIRGGQAFFAGGPGLATSTNTPSAFQTADVAASAPSIDAGLASARLSGQLGGKGSEADNMLATATFLDAGGSTLGTPLQIGPVTVAERKNITTLLPRAASGPVLAGTRSIRVRLVATRASGRYTDGYADNLALTLSAPAPPAGGGPGGPGPPAARPAALTRLTLSPVRFRAAKSGASIAARRKPKRTGTKVGFRLDLAATVVFTVSRRSPGVRKGKRCVAPPRKKPKKKPKRCTRVKKIGSFSRASTAGVNSFHFSGRVKKRALAPGKYTLKATTQAGTLVAGKARSKRFTIVR